MLDSDWELYPQSLERLAALIGGLPAGVRIIRSRLEMDGGAISPGVMPDGVTDYHGRLRWLEQIAVTGATSDAGHCMHRDVLAAGNYYTDRRGAIETLWELDLAQREPSLWVDDVLGRQHLDAVNSHTREASAARLVGRLVAEAPDQRWMAETMLHRHGGELERYAPRYRSWLLEMAAREALLAGDRRAGIRHTRAAAQAGSAGAQVWATLALGVIGPRTLARAKLAGRTLAFAADPGRERGWLTATTAHRRGPSPTPGLFATRSYSCSARWRAPSSRARSRCTSYARSEPPATVCTRWR